VNTVRAAVVGLLLLAASFAAGYLTRRAREPQTNPRALAAADSVLRDVQLHLATSERLNHQLADSLKASDTAVARYGREADRSGERARVAEATADTIRATRGTKPPLRETTAHDSAEYFRGELVDAELENAALRTALEARQRELAAKDSIDRIRQGDIVLLRTAGDDAAAQLSRTTAALEAARLAIANSTPRCRGPLGLPCPSRKAVAIGSVVAVVGVELLVAREVRRREFVQERNDSMLCRQRGVAIVRGC
jgi:hypothetical protein